ncbi:hypothetical protein [Paraflavitalea pollutisoli]|uniref:hypothetical protein n=1 Tax=Paraflavitalea pollutisoli TaxID=3034143 RepID=UPI0023ED84AD|nr:hypothetical protein [Paraflavitalea sp. H1-2-19X]
MTPVRIIGIVLMALCGLALTRPPQTPPSPRQQPAPQRSGDDLTVTYTIELNKSRNRSVGIGETYNGGTKTLFISNGLVRLRLVSLMRMQSIFILPPGNDERMAVIVKESGKNKHKVYLSSDDWRTYNLKYQDAICSLSDDTVQLSGYSCNKAVIELSDGRRITAWYTKQIQRPEPASVEPVFACVPGLVLKYIYEYKKGKITYTATSISNKQIDQNILKVPAKGYVEQPFQPGS